MLLEQLPSRASCSQPACSFAVAVVTLFAALWPWLLLLLQSSNFSNLGPVAAKHPTVGSDLAPSGPRPRGCAWFCYRLTNSLLRLSLPADLLNDALEAPSRQLAKQHQQPWPLGGTWHCYGNQATCWTWSKWKLLWNHVTQDKQKLQISTKKKCS